MQFNDVVLETNSCPLGCQPNDEPVLTGFDRLHNLPGKFQVVKCRSCGLMRTNPRPTPETMGFYYPDDYGPYQGTKVSPELLSSQSNSLLKRLIKRLLETNSTRLPLLVPGRMLEIGCASGSFLHQMANQGWDVEGLEFSDKAAQSARSLGYVVHTGTLEDAPEPDRPYDLVVGWMVLEHLHDPVACLKKLHRWVNPDGCLVISVPNAESLDFQIFKNALYSLQLPTHLYHYTPKTLNLILNKCGWQVDKVLHQRNLSNYIASSGYLLQDKGFKGLLTQFLMNFPEKAGKFAYLLYPLAYLLSVLGQTGRMTVWVRRVDD